MDTESLPDPFEVRYPHNGMCTSSLLTPYLPGCIISPHSRLAENGVDLWWDGVGLGWDGVGLGGMGLDGVECGVGWRC